MTLSTFIAGVGRALPERVVSNDELSRYFSTSDAWIQSKIGIRERRYVKVGEGTSDLATRAARDALHMAGWTPKDVEAIVVASSTPDYHMPGVGVLVQQKLGCDFCPAFDIHNSSPGFLFAMEMANALIVSGRYRRIVVIGAEVHSTGLDFTDRGRLMSVIFGDGAGAFAIEARDEKEGASVHTKLCSDGEHFDKLGCEAPASLYSPRLTHEMIDDGRIYPKMDGRFIFEQAVKRMQDISTQLLDTLNLSTRDIDWVVPHQANLRIIETLADALAVPRERVVTTIERYGNLSAASIPVAFAEAVIDGRLKRGDRILCPSFGSGFSWGAMMVRL